VGCGVGVDIGVDNDVGVDIGVGPGVGVDIGVVTVGFGVLQRCCQ